MSFFDMDSHDEGSEDPRDAAAKLDYWVKSHGLPEHFPLLDGRKKIVPYLRRGGSEIQEISSWVSGSLRSAIIFPDGQGASTLLRELVRRKRKSEDNGQLFIVLDPSSDEMSDFVGNWRYVAARSILFALATEGWVEKQQGLLRQSLLILLGQRSLEEAKIFSLQLLDRDTGASEIIESLARSWSVRLPELMHTIDDQIGLDTVVCLDVSSRCTSKKFGLVVRELKEFDEEKKPESYRPTCLREAWFLPVSLTEELGPWKSNFQEKSIDQYTNLEIFSVLEQHFRPRQPWRVPRSDFANPAPPNDGRLFDVLSGEYVGKIWNGEQTFLKFSQMLKDKLLQDVGSINRTKIDFLLRPRGD